MVDDNNTYNYDWPLVYGQSTFYVDLLFYGAQALGVEIGDYDNTKDVKTFMNKANIYLSNRSHQINVQVRVY